VKGGLAVGQGVAEFSFEAQTTIVLVLPEGASPQRFEATLPGPAGETLFVSVKALMYHGLLRLGRYDTPLDGEISLIDAKKDDPGRGEWRRGDPYSSQAMQEMLRNLNVNPMQGMLRNLNVNPMQGMLRNLNVNPMQGMLRNLNVNPMQEMPENQSGGAEPDPDDGNGEGPANTEP